MKLFEKLKTFLNENETEEEIKKEKKESINNLTQENDFLNKTVSNLFDLLDD